MLTSLFVHFNKEGSLPVLNLKSRTNDYQREFYDGNIPTTIENYEIVLCNVLYLWYFMPQFIGLSYFICISYVHVPRFIFCQRFHIHLFTIQT